MSTQYAQPFSIDARTRISSRSSGSSGGCAVALSKWHIAR
jgi:hypothetical protein